MTALRGLTGWARSHLPRPVARQVRLLLTGWGMLTARWRMTPAFLVVGAQRAGTTTLYRLLSTHPQVARPTVSKGIGYFDIHHDRGMRWYLSHFPVARLAARRGRTVTFESRGYYLWHPLAAERIARELPGVRVVAMLRDPVTRAYSAHQHEHARGFEDEDFERALELEPSRLEGEVDRMVADPGYRSHAHRHQAYLGRSEYAAQVQRFQEALGRDRVYVVDADRFFADPVGEFAELQRWLGLEVWDPDEVPRTNARERSAMDPELETRLRAHFAPHDRALARLLGRDPSWASAPGGEV